MTVHFRDIKDILSNVLTLWFFATPIIYWIKETPGLGKSVLDNQVVHFKLAEMQTEVELLRSLIYRAGEALALIEGGRVPVVAAIRGMARAPAKPAKPKQVARKRPPPERQAPTDPWQSWRFAQRETGWFGQSNRPFWGGRRDWN